MQIFVAVYLDDLKYFSGSLKQFDFKFALSNGVSQNI
jgi:hypothetical protein